jgi:hypothetical protein
VNAEEQQGNVSGGTVSPVRTFLGRGTPLKDGELEIAMNRVKACFGLDGDDRNVVVGRDLKELVPRVQRDFARSDGTRRARMRGACVAR